MKKREEKTKPSSFFRLSGREEYDEITFDAIKKGKDENLVSADCDRSTLDTVLLDDNKSTVVSSIEYNEQREPFSVIDGFGLRMQGNKNTHRKETAATRMSLDQNNRPGVDVKSKNDEIIVNIESINGSNTVLTTREQPALKEAKGGNGNNTNIVPHTSTSQIVGQRLHGEAQRRSQRMAYLRKVSRTIEPELELHTQSYERPSNWGASPSERFLVLYEQGKNRISFDRQLHKERSEERAPTWNEVTARYANVRQVNLHEHGRQRLIDRRQRAKKTENCAEVPVRKVIARFASLRLTRLYELGKHRVEKGRDLSDAMKYIEKDAPHASYANSRLSNLHDWGKRKITESRNRELEKKSKVSRSLSVEELASLRPNRRQILLSEIGRRRIFDQRLIAEHDKEKHHLFSCRLPPQFGEE